MAKTKVPKNYPEAFKLIGQAMHDNPTVRQTWANYVGTILRSTLALNGYILPDMDKLAEEIGDRFVTEWINKVAK